MLAIQNKPLVDMSSRFEKFQCLKPMSVWQNNQKSDSWYCGFVCINISTSYCMLTFLYLHFCLFISNLLWFCICICISICICFSSKGRRDKEKHSNRKNSFLQSAKSCPYLFLLIQFLGPRLKCQEHIITIKYFRKI